MSLSEEIANLERKNASFWEHAIEEKLNESGPMRTGDLISALGFDAAATAVDVGTAFTSGLQPFDGSFRGSDAQAALGRMVESGAVIWQRAENMDNWYGLPDQEFPREAAPRKRNLRQMMGEVVAALPDSYLTRFPESERNERLPDLEGIEEDDAWVEFYPFVLSMTEDGWELADGDPTCNWAGNTFEERFHLDVDGSEIAGMILAKIIDDPA